MPPIESELSGEIWFDSNREGNWDIFVMDANGSNVVNVTKTTERGEFGPVPSPDAKLIAYHAGNPKVGDGGMWGRWNMDGKEIWVMNRDGSNPRKLAENAITPAWWPDGKSLLYGSKEYGLCLHNLETGMVTQLLTEVKSWLNLGTVPVNFAPTTKKLVCGGGLNTTLCGMTIVVELDEKAQFKKFSALTTTYYGCTQRWSSPTGRSIWFAHHDPMHKGAFLLWSMKPDGTDVKKFWRVQDAFPGYGMYCESPDGSNVCV